MQWKFAKKISMLLIGVVGALMLLEGSLWVIGSGWRNKISLNIRAGEEKNSILCLGNSHTAGIGARYGEAYCDFLQARINSDLILKKSHFHVVNLGVPNFNSTQIRSLMEQSLLRFHPSLVLIMAGEANEWNYSGVKRESYGSVYDFLYRFRFFRLMGGIAYQLREKHKNSLVFPEVPLNETNLLGLKWFGLLDVNYHMFADSPEIQEEALGSLAKLAESDPKLRRDVSHLLSMLYQSWGKRLDLAFTWHARTMAGDPERFHYGTYVFLEKAHWMHPEDPFWSEYQILLKKSREHRPDQKLLERAGLFFQNAESNYTSEKSSVWPLQLAGLSNEEKVRFLDAIFNFREAHAVSMTQIALAFAQLGRVDRALDSFELLVKNNPYSVRPRLNLLQENGAQEPAMRQRIDSITRSIRGSKHAGDFLKIAPDELSHWVENDLTLMGALLKRSEVPFLFMTYPPLRKSKDRRFADTSILKVAAEKQFPVMDVSVALSSRFGADREKFYSNLSGPNDNHLNGEGNRLLGDVLFERIQSEGFLKSSAR